MLVFQVKQLAGSATRARLNHSERARDRQPMTTARNTHFNAAHARPHTTARPSTRQSTLGAGIATTDSGYVGKPTCDKCRTDEFVYLESYIPPTYRRDGSVATLGEVAYTCTRCEDFSAHSVPVTWSPPGWYLG
jgi:hypothetical protein